MPFLVPLLLLAVAYWSIPTEAGGDAPEAGAGAGSAWARARGGASRPTPRRGPSSEELAAAGCGTTPETLSLMDDARISAWAECPGRTIRDLRVVLVRLERARDDARDESAAAEYATSAANLRQWTEEREAREGSA